MKSNIMDKISNGLCFIIAEAGLNHNGDIKLAYKLIDAAKEAGADAVKFQTFTAEDLVIEEAEKAEYQKEATDASESQLSMLKKLELKKNEFKELAEYTRKKGIMFLSTPFGLKSVDILEDCGVPAYKISSGDLTNILLLKYVAEKGKPMIISTGMSNIGEVEFALEAIKEARDLKDIVLLHCVSNYPASFESINLKAMKTLEQAFGLPIGYSDHTEGITISIAAAALGAKVIEKHFTLDRNLPGPDHKASIEPDELRDMVTAIRDVEKAFGDGIKRAMPEELEIRNVARKSIVANEDIPEGTTITEEMLTMKRPGTGIPSMHIELIVGRTAKQKIGKDSLINWKQI